MSEKVMNNNDLRNIILSYFRKEPKIICCTCKKVCVWSEKVIRKYIEIPTCDYTVIYKQCMDCNYTAGNRDFF